MHRLAPLHRVIAIAGLCCTTMAHALDVPASIAQADGATGATVYLVPPMAIFGKPLDEAQMQAQGCRYTTSDPAAIAALVRLIRSGNVTSSAVYQRPDMREGVYLKLADGATLKFLLQDNNGSRLPVNGVVERTTGGDQQRVGVNAGTSLSSDLRRWAAGMRDGTGSACDRMVARTIAP